MLSLVRGINVKAVYTCVCQTMSCYYRNRWKFHYFYLVVFQKLEKLDQTNQYNLGSNK